MGKSLTIHCIGQRKKGALEYGMTKLEVYQKTLLYQDIEYWYNQTDKGLKILGGGTVFREEILNNPPKGIINCVCKNSCPLCKGSKKTTRKEIRSYKDWQIGEFKRR